MKRFSIIIITIITILAIETLAQQGKAGKIGIGYSGDLTSATNEWGMSFWLSNRVVLEPQLGFVSVDIKDNSATAWKPGLGFLYRFNDFIVSSFIGARIKGNILSNDSKTYSDLILSLVFGGEYFVSEYFSVGAEMRLNYVKTDKDFSPSYDVANASILESEQVLNIRIYFW